MRSLLSWIRKVAPWLTPLPNIVLLDIRELIRFARYNTNNAGDRSADKLLALITRSAHGLEKAVSLPRPRDQYGSAQSLGLLKLIDTYYSRFGRHAQVEMAIRVLRDYLGRQGGTSDEASRLQSALAVFETKYGISPAGEVMAGGKRFSYNQFVGQREFDEFFVSRYSVRHYRPTVIDSAIVRDIIRVATKTPSACNRQGWRVRLYHGQKAVSALMKYQYGNRGFGENLYNALLVTGKLSAFASKERFQAYVDGGLFCMSLMLAMHARGIASCPMNTSFTRKEDRRFREFSGIPDDEVPIMIIVFGEPHPDAQVAISSRRPTEHILTTTIEDA